MFRDHRLTLRDNSALIQFSVEAISHNGFILAVPDVDPPTYIKIGGDKNCFIAEANREEAQRFQIQVTDLGLELWYERDRLSVFDDYYDVSVEKREKGRSRIPILIHYGGLAQIWEQGRSGGIGGVSTRKCDEILF